MARQNHKTWSLYFPRFHFEIARFRTGGLECNVVSQPELTKSVVHFFPVKVDRAELFQFAIFEMFGDVRVRLQLLEEIGIVTTSMFDRPGLHRIALNEVVGLLAAQTFLD